MPDRPRIVVAEPPAGAEWLRRLRESCDVIEAADGSPAALIELLPGALGLVVRVKTHVTARMIEAGAALRVIGRAGPSLDHVDLRAAARRGIVVVYAPTAQTASIAEFIVGQMLACVRRLAWFDRKVRENQFERVRLETGGRELRCLTIGLLGGGPVADAVAAILSRGFGARVIACAPPGVEGPGDGVVRVEMDTLLAESDVLSVHLPQRPELTRFLSTEALAKMKPTAVLVNSSRGSVIDHAALAERLKTRRLGGAAIDVFDAEPLPLTHPLRNAPHCLLTPHIAANTADANDACGAVVDDVLRVLRGEPPLHSASLPAVQPE